MFQRWLAAAAVMAVAGPMATPAVAEGEIEINEAAVLAGNITPGDLAGYPAELYLEGTYRLTGNLEVTDENTTAILLLADNITIDLNGFSIIGPVTCTGIPVTSCSPSGGLGDGIGFEPAPSVSGVTIRNGTVRGVGRRGIRLGELGQVVGVRAVENGSAGIYLGFDGIVEHSVAFRNGDFGIFVSGGQVSDSWSRGNLASGISVQGGFGGRILNSTSRDNGTWGLALGGGGYGGNVIENNGSGTVIGTASEIGANVCDGNTTCP